MLNQLYIYIYHLIGGLMPRPRKRHWIPLLAALLILFSASYALATDLKDVVHAAYALAADSEVEAGAAYALIEGLEVNAEAPAYDLKLKSEALAYVLAFDPLPGDALFYAGKYGQGVVNTVLGLAGGFFFWSYFAALASDSGNYDEEFEDFRNLGLLVMGLGAAVYFPMLIWDGVVGVREVKKHNAMVARQRKAAWWKKVQPGFAMTGDGYAAAATFNF